MSKSSKVVGVALPEMLYATLGKHLRRDQFAEFLRIAAVEKLNRSFGEEIPVDAVKIFGKRSDLANASAGTLEKMRKQAAVARAGKKRKSQAKPSPHRRESGSGVSNIPNPEGRGVSDLRKLPSVPESVRRPSKHKKTQSNEN